MNQSFKSVKILTAAAFTGTMLFGVPLYAEGVEVTDVTYTTDTALNESMKSKANTTPTLDHLKANNPDIKGAEVTYTYSDGSTGTYHYSNDFTITTGSGYHYDNVEEPEQQSVTFWDVNKTTGEMTPSYYNTQLNQTEYGTTDGDTVKYYEPASDYTSVPLYQAVETPSGDGSTITVRYNAPDASGEAATVSNPEGETIENINSTFTDAGVYNEGTIENINSTFAENSGVINEGTIENINSTFTEGSYVYNESTIGNITSSFIYSSGVHNIIDAQITGISGAFIGNVGCGYTAYTGAISNWGIIGDIAGTFSGNLAYAYEPGTASTTSEYKAYGGAIYNGGSIGNVTGDFLNNEAVAAGDDSVKGYANGGAIFNGGSIGNVTGDFIRNSAFAGSDQSYDEAKGGAIYNTGIITKITGDFIANNTTHWTSTTFNVANWYFDDKVGVRSKKTLYGGAISNDMTTDNNNNYYGEIGEIAGNFTGNFIEGAAYKIYAGGGAVYNTSRASIDSITGNFNNNYINVSGIDAYAYGGAIANSGEIGEIKGDFSGNHIIAKAVDGNITYSSGTTVSIDGFSEAAGGAILNVSGGSIETINGNFTDNHVEGTTAQGGAIYNYRYSTIENITGDFTGNYAEGESLAQGGAIANSGTIGEITGNFNDNHAKSSDTSYGGAIDNCGTLTVSGNFTGNSAEGVDYAAGGAISNSGTVNIVNSNFTNNYAKSENTTYGANGGAISNINGKVNITADNFDSKISGNYTEVNGVKDNVAISNADKNVAPYGNSYLTLNAVNNGSVTLDDKITGADGSHNTSTVTLTGDSTGTLNIYNDITNSSVIAEKNVKVNLANDVLHDYAMNKVTSADTVRYGIDVDLDNETADTITTANSSSGTVTLDSINYTNSNVKEGEYKVQVLKTQGSSLQLALSDGLTSDENILLQEKVKVTDNITSDANWKDSFTVNTKTTDIYGQLDLATTDTDNDSIGVTISSVKEFNSSAGAGDTIKVWSEQATPATTDPDTGETVNVDRNFNFDSANDTYKVTENLGNPSNGVLNINGKTDNEGKHSTIDLDGHEGMTLDKETTLNIKDTTLTGNDKVLTVDSGLAEVNLDNATLDGDIITGDEQYKMGITGDTRLNGSVGKAEVTIGSAKDPEHPENDASVAKINNSTIVSPNSFNNFEKADVTAYGGTINLINDKPETQLAQSFTVAGDTIFNIDADLANVSMDRLPENTTVQNGAMINVNQINLVSDSKGEKTVIPFAYDSFKNSVDYTGPDELSKETQVTTAFAPIYKYGVSYNKDDGMFTFLRGAGSNSNSSNAFNPAVLASPVAAQAGALTAQTMAFNYAFRHADSYMPLPSADRFAMRNSNRFASTSYENVDLRTNDLHEKGIWVQPYASFENIKLKHGPKVDTISYGTMVGGDSNFKELRNGWGTIFTGYAGYAGSSQSYGGVDTYQNGGLLGATQTFYKKNFFTALTVSAGAMVGESHTMYGHDNFTSLMAGVASKSGYNLEFKDGKFIIQPSMMMSYTFINTFDYTNAAGVRINSDPLHAIQLNPNVRFIGNLKNGWQPYASVGMVWNILDDTKVTANDVRLPEMSVKPYVEYGLGIQKRWNDKFTGFGQVMIRNGGRNGVALTAGFRWALGKEGKPIEKTQRPNGNFNASLQSQNRFLSSDINGKNWSAANEKTAFGRPMGSAANIDSERPQNVFGL